MMFFLLFWGQNLLSQSKIKIYFTQPVDTTVSNGLNAIYLNQKLDDTLVAYINRTKYTLDIAIYNLNLNGVRDAINNAYIRGIAVRFITDTTADTTYYNALNISTNKKMRPSSISGAMHNKFMIMDANSANSEDAIVWMGSANFTYASMNVDDNNAAIIQDKNLALAYQTEFEEMWNGTFGTYKNDNTPHEFIIDGKRVELYFSPSDTVTKKIINAINTADKDLEFAMFNFTSQYIANAIAAKINNGIFSAGIIEDTAYGTNPYNTMYAQMDSLLLIDKQSAVLHHKYAVIDRSDNNDDPLVITGSHNWTVSADTRNDENTLIIHDDTIVNLYYQEWVARFKDNGGKIDNVTNGNLLTICDTDLIKVFPCPANNQLFIRSSKHGIITLNDILGREIIQTSVFPDQAISVDISSFDKGIYLLRMTGNQSWVVKKIIKE